MDDIKTDKRKIQFSIEWHRQNKGLYRPDDGLYRKNKQYRKKWKDDRTFFCLE